MKRTFEAWAKKLFGARYERVKRTLLTDLILFWGLYLAELQVRITPFVLYLMVSAVSAGVMWQALSSQDNAAALQNMLMLPFERRAFVFAYVGALGTYVLLTKTAALLAVLLAVSPWGGAEIAGGLLCAVHAVLMAAAVFALRRYWYAGVLWAGAALAVMALLGDSPWFFAAVAAGSILALLVLRQADGYAFYLPEGRRNYIMKSHRRHSVWRYLFRYMRTHKNYLANTAAMWGVACVLPLFFRDTGTFAVPVCFAILTLNTPVCILLSCDPDLEQAVRLLPDGERMFLAPYCLFIFLCNITAAAVFLCSFRLQQGSIAGWMIAAAVFFALQSAVCSALLEWLSPVRGWKIESDLWHHPRKYAVPAAMLLLAGAVAALPKLAYVLCAGLGIELAACMFLPRLFRCKGLGI